MRLPCPWSEKKKLTKQKKSAIIENGVDKGL
jgi:hypothetical protein